MGDPQLGPRLQSTTTGHPLCPQPERRVIAVVLQLKIRIAHSPPVPVFFRLAFEYTPKSLLESFPEVSIEMRINDRVQHGIEVADPEENRHHDVRARAGFAAQRRDDVPEKERHPAGDEGAHDDAEGPGGFVLLLHLDGVAVLLRGAVSAVDLRCQFI